jgi:hypothetical protein
MSSRRSASAPGRFRLICREQQLELREPEAGNRQADLVWLELAQQALVERS